MLKQVSGHGAWGAGVAVVESELALVGASWWASCWGCGVVVCRVVSGSMSELVMVGIIGGGTSKSTAWGSWFAEVSRE